MEDTLQAILDRNKRVEAEKAWEVSLTRRFFIAGLTYVTASILMWFLDQPQFLLLSLIPAIAYLLSTLSLPWMKSRWLRRHTNDS